VVGCLTILFGGLFCGSDLVREDLLEKAEQVFGYDGDSLREIGFFYN